MKKSVYIDSTILSFLYDKRIEIQFLIRITKKWWKEQRHNYEMFLSEETLKELGQSNYPNNKKVLRTALTLPILPYHQDISEIALVYINNFLCRKN